VRALSDKIVAQLRVEMQAPDLSGTRYRAIRFLAHGGMGDVWLVEDATMQRNVALKVVQLEGATDKLGERLLREARILAQLEHPGIVPVHDAGTLADRRAYYCMKYIEGRTLAQHACGLSLHEKLRLLGRIAEAVEFAHSRGVIHRDLKPDNIMVGAFGEVLIMDWGVARAVAIHQSPDGGASARAGVAATPAVTAHGVVLGTPGYMSPEQARGEHSIDHRTDIFALGAILRFLVTGKSAEGPDEPSGAFPRPLRAVCLKATAFDPENRYPSVAEFASELELFLLGLPVRAHRETLLDRARRFSIKHRTALALIGVYLLMRLLFILFSPH